MAIFGNLFKTEQKSVLGVDIGTSAIKIVQISKKNGQAVLETYGELALGPYSGATVGQAVSLPAEKVAEAVKDLINEKEVKVTTRKSGVSIPFASSLMASIEMPVVPEKQLVTMVPLEARKYIPVPINEVQLDWSVIPKDPDAVPQLAKDGEPLIKLVPKLEVLVVAIHNDILQRFKTIVDQSGLLASFFEIELFSTMRAVVEDGLKPVMIMDIGAASTKLYIVERGVIRGSHTVSRGSQDITQNISQSLSIPIDKAELMKREHGLLGEQQLTEIISLSLDYIMEEANRTLLSFEKKYNKTVSKVILVGGGATLKGLPAIAKESFKTETELGDPFSKLATPAFLEHILKETGPEFAVAIGLALRRLSEEG
ncbi:MAG: type IV pilus assembly protein PilM [Parcubacteria group bacterium]